MDFRSFDVLHLHYKRDVLIVKCCIYKIQTSVRFQKNEDKALHFCHKCQQSKKLVKPVHQSKSCITFNQPLAINLVGKIVKENLK